MKLRPFTLITLAATAVAFGGLITFLIVSDRDPVLFISAIVTLIPALGVLFGVNKAVKQTNGNLSKLSDYVAAKDVENSQLRSLLPPEDAVKIPIVSNHVPPTI